MTTKKSTQKPTESKISYKENPSAFLKKLSVGHKFYVPDYKEQHKETLDLYKCNKDVLKHMEE